MIKNFIESVNMGWNNLSRINKIILFIIWLPSLYLGTKFIIQDITWVINKIF